MKQLHGAGLLSVAVALTAALLVNTGCEDGPSDDGVEDYFSNNPYQSTSMSPLPWKSQSPGPPFFRCAFLHHQVFHSLHPHPLSKNHY